MHPLITIIVPIYNVEPYIRKCIDSILAQTYKNLEIILIDDGSPDNCPKICDEYAIKDNRIRVIHKENGGISDARNIGLETAKGEYIGFVDPDDWIAPDMYEYLLKGLFEYKACISCCPKIDVYKDYMQYNLGKDEVYKKEEALAILFGDYIGNYVWNRLYKSELWKNIRFPIGRNFEDVLTLYKTFEEAENIVFLKEPKYYYLRRDDSITRNIDFQHRKHIYMAFIDRYEEVVPRMPQYIEPLFNRIFNRAVYQTSRLVIRKPEDSEENLYLLNIVVTFVNKHKDEILNNCKLTKIERKKIEAFCKGTLSGCKKCYIYHNLNEIIKKTKMIFRKILK